MEVMKISNRISKFETQDERVMNFAQVTGKACGPLVIK